MSENSITSVYQKILLRQLALGGAKEESTASLTISGVKIDEPSSIQYYNTKVAVGAFVDAVLMRVADAKTHEVLHEQKDQIKHALLSYVHQNQTNKYLAKFQSAVVDLYNTVEVNLKGESYTSLDQLCIEVAEKAHADFVARAQNHLIDGLGDKSHQYLFLPFWLIGYDAAESYYVIPQVILSSLGCTHILKDFSAAYFAYYTEKLRATMKEIPNGEYYDPEVLLRELITVSIQRADCIYGSEEYKRLQDPQFIDSILIPQLEKCQAGVIMLQEAFAVDW